MKNFNHSYAAAFLILLAIPFMNLPASGDGDHSHAASAKNESTPSLNYFSSESSSDKYELLIRYEPITTGSPSHLTLFVSEYATNRPVDKAVIKITSREDSQMNFKIVQSGEGTYLVETTFPEKKTYSFAVNIHSHAGPDLILISNIESGKKLISTQSAEESTILIKWQTWLLTGLALLAGAVIGILFQKRRTGNGRKAAAIFLLIVYCMIPASSLTAHGDEEHASGSSGGNFSNSLHVPKETQFLFDVFTDKLQKWNFSESTKLFGTIIPGSSGQALVTTPQHGKIVSLKVRVGQKISAGDPMATIEQSLDAGTQVSMMTEKNSLAAEADAARKEYERLSTIADIAAKKDIDEARARLQKAEQNLSLLSGSSGKTFLLKAPISGVVSNFNLSQGSTVNAGQTIFTITNLSQIYAEAQVFDKDASKVKAGAKFTIECVNDNHQTSEVELLSLAQEINSTNQSQRVLFSLSNPDGDFKIGEFVNIRVFSGTGTQQISLPNSAITEINGKPVVFVKESAETYTVSYVQTGENNGTHTSIIKGIEEGERVVVNASYQLKMIYLNQ